MLVDLVRVCEYVLLPYTCGITTGLARVQITYFNFATNSKIILVHS